MKKGYLLGISIMMTASMMMAQGSYMTPADGFKADDIVSNYKSFIVFDVYENMLYASDGDTIRCFDLEKDVLLSLNPRPQDYQGYASFLTISENGNYIWTGYTVTDNADDRIYRIDIQDGTWELIARMPANFDLELLNDHILVTGLNSTSWDDPASVFVLDTSGNNNHRKIIEIGGSPAGLGISLNNDIYYGTSFFGQQNALYRWDSAELVNVLNNPTLDSLTLDDATKLSDLPASAYDCHVDAGDNVLFNANDFLGDKLLAKWNGVSGDGSNYDTLGIAEGESDWLSYIKSVGNIEIPETGNSVYALSFGQAIADLHLDYLPVLTKRIKNPEGFETAADKTIDLTPYFMNPDDPSASFNYDIVVNTDSSVAIVTINEQILTVDYLAPGQANIVFKAESAGQYVDAHFVVGVYPEISGNFETIDYGDLILEPNSYWNGSDQSGGFHSGSVFFPNDYNPDFGSWSKWAYSNMGNDSVQSWMNQYSVISGYGFDTTGTNQIYGVSYVPIDWMTSETTPVPLYIDDTSSKTVQGFFINNSTYTALTMENGNDFAKKFGGEDGNDPDWLKLEIWGYLNGMETDTIDYYLADFRFENNTKDYIIKTWQWVDISEIGKIDSLYFNMTSSDVGMYGINTPTYFCMDNLYIKDGSSSVKDNFADKISFVIYPNPSKGVFSINYEEGQKTSVRVINLYGQNVYSDEDYQSDSRIDISNFAKGVYIVQLQRDNLVSGKMILIH